MRILVIDDSEEMAALIRQNLESEYFAVDVANDGERGLFLARTNEYSAVILDYMLPKMNGKNVCAALRKEGRTMPILMVSVKTEIPDKVDVLNIGADDYLTKPFSGQELVARLRALLRRTPDIRREIFQFQDVELDVQKHRVTRAGTEIHLTRKEFMLLEYLLRHAGDVVNRTAIIEHVWDAGLDSFSNTLETHVLNLRKKLEAVNSEKIIQTVSGVGYSIR
jgi:DNA-binding response OmpR family regulator